MPIIGVPGQIPVPIAAPASPGPAVTLYLYDCQTLNLLAELPVNGLGWSQRLNSYGTLNGVLRIADKRVQAALTSGATSAGRTLACIDVNGALVWCGRLLTRQYLRSTRQLTISGTEALSYLDDRLQAADYAATWATATDSTTIAQQVISDALAVSGTAYPFTFAGGFVLSVDESVANPNPISVSYPISSVQSISSILSILSANGWMVGFDHMVDVAWANGQGSQPQLTLNISYPRRGRIAGSTGLVLDSGSFIDFAWNEDATKQANRITGIGAGGASLQEQLADPTVTSAGYPLTEVRTSYTAVNTASALKAAVEGDLAQLEWPVVSAQVTVPLVGDPSIGDFTIGDDIRLVVAPGDELFTNGLDTYLRIVAADFKVPDSGKATMMLSLSTPPGAAPVPPPPIP